MVLRYLTTKVEKQWKNGITFQNNFYLHYLTKHNYAIYKIIVS